MFDGCKDASTTDVSTWQPDSCWDYFVGSRAIWSHSSRQWGPKRKGWKHARRLLVTHGVTNGGTVCCHSCQCAMVWDAETAPWEPPRGPPPPRPTRMHSPSPTDSELGAVAAQLEEEEHLRADRDLQEAAHGRDEEVQNDYYQQLHEEHLAWRARSWDDWAMHDEMQHLRDREPAFGLHWAPRRQGRPWGAWTSPWRLCMVVK